MIRTNRIFIQQNLGLPGLLLGLLAIPLILAILLIAALVGAVIWLLPIKSKKIIIQKFTPQNFNKPQEPQFIDVN